MLGAATIRHLWMKSYSDDEDEDEEDALQLLVRGHLGNPLDR